MERKWRKLVGRDEGSLTENKENSNNNNTDKENTQNKTEQLSLPNARCAPKA